MRGELESIAPADLITVRMDVQRMAAIVLTIAWHDSAPERRAVFERFAAQGNYDIRLLDRLPAVSRVAWFVRRQQIIAVYAASGATVSKDEVALAYSIRARMTTVLDHWVRQRHDIATKLDQIREGSGHQELANDLETLTEIYSRDDVREFIERDVVHYRESDPIEATRLAGLLMASLGLIEEGEAERLTALTQRAATQLVRSYDGHARCGRFFFGKYEDVAATYPSLYTAARSPRRKRPVEGPAGGEAPNGGGEPAGEGGESGESGV